MTDSGKQRTERDRQREATHRRVYEAALEVFRDEGMDAAKIEDIVRRAGVSRGTFYFHFPRKDDVLLERVEQSEEALVDKLEELPDDASLADVLELIATEMAAEWAPERELLGDLAVAVLRTVGDDVEQARQGHPVREALVPRVEAAMERGEISQLLPPDVTADFFLVNLFGAAVAWVGNPVMELDDLLRSMIVFFLRAARPE